MNGVYVPIVMFITAGATTVLFPVARAFARRMEKQADQQLPSHVEQRLERMEQSIDAIAEQVERIAEGQRFTTKLLSDKTENRLPNLQSASSGGSS